MIGQRQMGGSAKDTIDAQRQRRRRDGVAMRNIRDGRRRATSNGRGDTTQKDAWKKVDDKKETGRRTLFTRDDHGRFDGIRIEMIAGNQRTAR